LGEIVKRLATLVIAAGNTPGQRLKPRDELLDDRVRTRASAVLKEALGGQRSERVTAGCQV
jgi:hypothetical protein